MQDLSCPTDRNDGSRRLVPWPAGQTVFAFAAALLLAASAAPASADDPAAPPESSATEAAPPASPSAAPASPMYAAPLMTAAEEEDWKRNHSLKFTKAKGNARLSAQDEAELALGVKNALYRMTLEAHADDIPKTLTQPLLDDVRRATKPARSFMLEEIRKLAPKLLDQPPIVRMNLMILLANLESDPDTDPPTPYVEAYKIMTGVLADPQQTLDAKLWAVHGLGRICEDTDPVVVIRNEAAMTMIDELMGGSRQVADNAWYRRILVEGIGRTGRLYNIANQPVIIDTLMSHLTDTKESALVRATAAQSISKLPFQPDTNLPLINFEIAQLTHDAAVAYNQNMKPANWRWTFARIYFAYRPAKRAELERRKWGLQGQVTRPGLAQHQTAVDEVYKLVLPVLNAVLVSPPQPIPDAAIQNLDEWLKKNVPQSRKVTPQSNELPKVAVQSP